MTNPEVNKLGGKYIYNRDPNSCKGHKWRLTCLWEKMVNEGSISRETVSKIWTEIGNIAVKTLLSAHSEISNRFSSRSSMYNTYSLLGFDFLLDSDLRPHLLEVNTRPQLLPYPVDSAVNRPMVIQKK